MTERRSSSSLFRWIDATSNGWSGVGADCAVVSSDAALNTQSATMTTMKCGESDFDVAMATSDYT
jgi:hypothetical protein